MIKFILLVLSIGIAPTVDALESDLPREIATTTIIVDWLQTREIAKHPESHKEGQIYKIIGIHPSKASVNWYFASKIGLHYIINEYLVATRYRAIYNGLTIVGGIDIINHNYRAGLRIEF